MKTRTGLNFLDTWASPGKLPRFLLDYKHPPENSFRPGLGFFVYLVGFFCCCLFVCLFFYPVVSGKSSYTFWLGDKNFRAGPILSETLETQ